MNRIISQYKNKFNRDDYRMVFSPYRICPLGAHVDHQLGLITGFTIDKGIYFIFGKREDSFINIISADFPDKEYFDMKQIVNAIPGSWGNYMRGSILALSHKYVLKFGLDGIATGTLPIGGLSSSAAVSSAYLMALAFVNNITLTSSELIELVAFVEHNYIGLNNGILDQSVNILSKKNHLLYMDTKTCDYKLVERNEKMKEFEVVVVYSGISKSLISTDYNERVNECRCAAWMLLDILNKPRRPFNKSVLRDVNHEEFFIYKDKLPKTFLKRATHFYNENIRVKDGLEAWEKGDLVKFGKLVSQSGLSSINDYECGSKELIDLYNILGETIGVYGCRFSGAGYRGCVIGLIEPRHKDMIKREVTEKYLNLYPQFDKQFRIDFCKTDDGVRLI